MIHEDCAVDAELAAACGCYAQIAGTCVGRTIPIQYGAGDGFGNAFGGGTGGPVGGDCNGDAYGYGGNGWGDGDGGEGDGRGAGELLGVR